MTMKKLIIFTAILLFTAEFAHSQWNIHWRRLRHEVIIGAGGTNFLGDLGGSPYEGTHFVRDFDIQSSRWLLNAGYRYKLAEEWAIRGSLSFGRLSGNDKFTTNIYRNARNLHFRSPILELGVDIQYSFVRERYGHRYDLRRVKGRNNIPNVYIFTGISGIYFNPKAEYTNGDWIALQPLGTEGQGVMPTRPVYSKFSAAIPLGFGLNYMIDKDFGVGFEFGVRYAFTDYIDDVSATYVHPSVFGDDEIARYFSNPPTPEGEVWIGSGIGNQRGGNFHNDAYMFLTINLTYKLSPKTPGRAKF
jgi:hypothetical protein